MADRLVEIATTEIIEIVIEIITIDLLRRRTRRRHLRRRLRLQEETSFTADGLTTKRRREQQNVKVMKKLQVIYFFLS